MAWQAAQSCAAERESGEFPVLVFVPLSPPLAMCL